MNRKLIIQITDMHLFGNKKETLLGVTTWESFRAVVADVYRHYPNPDIILLTGDLAQDETITAYRHLVHELDIFHCPKYGIPGNHDDARNMLSIFHECHLQENKEIIFDNWNIILLNTQKRHAVEGLLDEKQLDFLGNSLGNYPEHHTLIFMHHPPVPVQSEWIDRLMLSNADAFWDILAPYHHIKSIFCGHVHQMFMGRKNGVDVYTSPSTCFQFEVHSKKFSLGQEMPGYRIIQTDENGNLETQVHRLVDFNLNIDQSSKGY